MKRKMLGFFICIVLIGTVTHTVIAKQDEDFVPLNYENEGVFGGYRSIIEISSPDGNNYHCIMYCRNHKQTSEWARLINESGFQKAWIKQFSRLVIFSFIPGTKFYYGLNDFKHWYSELFIKLRQKDEFMNFINSYDKETGSGMITYKWLSGTINKPIGYKSQPDNTWVENSWILDDYGKYIPNPEIWDELPYTPYLP